MNYESNIVLSENQYKVVGTRPVRHDGVDKVTGRALYGADIHMPQLIDKLKAENHSVHAFPIHEYWMDVGHPEILQQVRVDLS